MITYWLLILSIFIWPFGQLLNISIPGYPVSFYPLDIICGFIAVSLIASKKGRQNIAKSPLFAPLVLFLSASIFSLIPNISLLAGNDFVFPLFYLARLIIYPFVFFAVSHQSETKIMPYIKISLVMFLALGVLQYVLFPDLRYLKYLGFDDHYYRLAGSFYDPNFTGAIMSAVSLILLYFNRFRESVFMLLLLGLTFSRASYLAFMFGLIYMMFQKKNWRLLIFLLVLIVTIIAIPKPFGEGVNLFRTFSIYSRIDSWKNGLELFVDKPVFGWGFNTLRSITGERFQIDNSVIYILATTGVIGFVALINLVRSAVVYAKAPVSIFLITILIHSLFNNSLFYIWIYYAFWFVLALKFREYKQS